MKTALLTMILATSSVCYGALPNHFSNCLRPESNTNMSITDLKELSKVTKMTVCQNQVTLIGRTEAQDLLRANADLAVSLGKMNYSYSDLVELAKAGSYLLYVDSTKLNRVELTNLAKEGVQLAIMSESSGLSMLDLRALASEKPYIFYVSTYVAPADLKSLINSKVHVVVRPQANISGADLVSIAQENNTLLSIIP